MTTGAEELGVNREGSTARTTDADDSPSLMDVLAWRDSINTYVAHNFPHSAEQQEVFAAVGRLVDLARTALESPTKHRLRNALRNDPYCAAAYAHGARQAEERMARELAVDPSRSTPEKDLTP